MCFGRIARLSLAHLLLLSFPSIGQQKTEGKRVPSTAEERAKAVELTRRLEEDPLSKDAKDIRSSLVTWLTDVPDLKVEVCDLLPDLLHSEKNYSAELFVQTVISSGAFVAANPDLTEDHLLVNTAGVVGTLKAYQAILKSHPEAKWPVLDDLINKAGMGELPGYVREATAKCKQTLSPDDDGKNDKIDAANDHLHKGNKFYDGAEYQLALIEYGRAAALIPDRHNAYHELSQTFYSLKNYGKAIEYANHAIQLNPKCWLCYQALGNIYDDSGKPGDALVQYGKAIELVPNSGRPLFNYALTLDRLRREPEAISALEKAIRVDPGYASPYRLLGILLARHGEVYPAKEHFEKFAELERNGKRFEEVSQLLKPAVHLDPDRVKPNSPQMDAYAAYGVTRAEWVVNEYRKRNPSSTIYKLTLEEEIEALRSEATKWQELKKAKPSLKDDQLDRLLRIHEAGWLEAFAYSYLADRCPVEGEKWKAAHPEVLANFRKWTLQTSLSPKPIEQPLTVEWVGQTF